VKRPTPPPDLTEAFREQSLKFFTSVGPESRNMPMRLYDGGPACWLKQFDPLDRPCSGDLEAFHFIGRQQLRRALGHQLTTDAFADGAIDALDVADLVELAEWDPRNGGPGCTGHHRRFDSHSTPGLTLRVAVLPAFVFDFLADWGLESEAQRKFDGDLYASPIYQRVAPREMPAS